MQQGHTWGFVDAPTLGFDDAVFDLVAHAQTMTATNFIGFEEKGYGVGKSYAVQCDGLAFFKTHTHGFCFDLAVFAPERYAHDGVDDLNAAV